MLRRIAKPLGEASLSLGESIGKDYLQKKSIKVAQGIYDDKSLSTNTGFLITGNKPMKPVNLNKENVYNKENIYNSENITPTSNKYNDMFSNFGGKKIKKNKGTKSKKTKKTKRRKY